MEQKPILTDPPHQQNEVKKRHFPLPLKILAEIILLIILAMVIERFIFNDQHIKYSQMSKAPNGEACKSDPNPVFKAAFTDLSKILYINPLGNTQAGSTGRSYIVVKEGMEAPIYNPTDAVLETIVYAKRGDPNAPGEYGLYFRTDCKVTYLFDHIDRVSDKIKTLAPQVPADTTQKEKGTQPKVLIKKGELLGYSNGTPQARTFDFLLLNQSIPASHINPKRWQWEQALYAQCPYDYFDTRNDNNLKRDYIGYNLVNNDNIIQKVWNKEQGVKDIPCGNVSHDIDGTTSGGWFKNDSTDIKGDYLSVNKYLSTVQISIRRDGQLVEALADYSRDVLPAEVKVGQSTCYHDANQNKWAFVKLISNNQLALAKGNGTCPVSFPQKNSDLWKR